MESYRIEVGRKHNVQAGNIVGAIANESAIDPDDIGRINIQDEYSIIDMRKGIPRSVWRMLKKIRVSGKEMEISKLNESSKMGVKKQINNYRSKPRKTNT